MKRRSIFLISLVMGITVCAACRAPVPAPVNEWTVTDGITLRLAQDKYPVGVKWLTLILENHTEKVMLYGQGWSFEKYAGGRWTVCQSKQNYGFTLEGHILYAYDKQTFSIPTDFLEQELTAGLYRITGCTLRVADDENQELNGRYTDYPAYKLEFLVDPGAADEPEAATPSPGAWELPDKEAWQWYTPWERYDMYRRSGMEIWQGAALADGLEAILYRETDSGNLETGDKLMLDIFDRKTGKRYVIFDSETVLQDGVSVADVGGIYIETNTGRYYADITDGKLIIKSQP